MKLETINEALRFGQREINELKSDANNILVSFEYEFTFVQAKAEAVLDGIDSASIEVDESGRDHPWADDDGDFDPSDEDITGHRSWDEEYDRAVDDYVESMEGEDTFDVRQVEQDLNDLSTELEEAGVDGTVTLRSIADRVRTYMNDFETVYSNAREATEDMRKFQTIIEVMEDSTFITEMNNHADEYENSLGRISELEELEEVDRTEFEANLREFDSMEHFAGMAKDINDQQDRFAFFEESLNDAYNRMIADWEPAMHYWVDFFDIMDTLIDNMDNLEGNYIESVRTSAREDAHESESVDEDTYRRVREVMEYEFRSDLESGDYENAATSNRFGIVRVMLSDRNNKWGLPSGELEAVVDDVSVTNGVEVTFKPMPILKALDTLQDMCAFIQDVGSTADNTAGLHCNISIKGRSMHVRDINPFRFALLADQQYLLKYFPIRRHVQRMLETPSSYDIRMAVMKYINGGLTALVEHSEMGTMRLGKFQTVNFMNAMQMTPESQRRIEFRAPGGSDYHLNPEFIVWHTWRMAYMLFASTSETFENRDYYAKVYKFWDKAAMNALGTDFSTLVREYKANDGEDFVVRNDFNKNPALSKPQLP